MSKIGGTGGGKLPPIVRDNADSLKPTLRTHRPALPQETFTSQTSSITTEDLSEALKNLGFYKPKALHKKDNLTEFQADVASAVKNMGHPVPRGISVH